VYCRGLLVLSAALGISGCSSNKRLAPPKYAVIKIENLTQDPALDWIGRAASAVLTREIGAIPVASGGFSDALLAGANRIVSGYFDQSNSGALTFHLAIEDAPTGRRVRDLSERGSVLDACADLARQIVGTPKPYATRNEEALRAYVKGKYEDAAAADPGFADAYLGWAEAALARKDAKAVDEALAQAQAHKIDAGIMAKLQFVDAAAHNDTNARTAALKQMVALDPANVADVQALGEMEMAEHHYSEAAAVFAKGASPARPDLINLKTYALMFAGDENGALEAVHEYQKARPQDPNAIDSEGDIDYYFGHFGEAEKLYLNAAAKDPQFIQGGEIWKAARAHLMTGDVAGATVIFNRYRAEREKTNDRTMPFRSAYWQFITGDRAGGLAAMHIISDPLSLAQAAIWELQLGRTSDALKDADAVLKAGQNASVVQAAIVRFSALPPANLSELKGDGGAQIRILAIAYAAYVKHRYADAAKAWKELYDKSNPSDPTPAFIYGGSLYESGRTAEAAPILKYNPPPPTNLAPSFESLYFPELFDWRGDHATFLKLSGLKLSGSTATRAK